VPHDPQRFARVAAALLLAFGTLCARVAVAQIGSGTDILTGRVATADGNPIANAEIEA